MWHYIGNKKNKLWIWKALDRNTGHLVDWECGGRDKETLEKLTTRSENGQLNDPELFSKYG